MPVRARDVRVGATVEIRWRVERVGDGDGARARPRGRWTWWPAVVASKRGDRLRVNYDRDHDADVEDEGGFESVVTILDDQTCVDASSDGTPMLWRLKEEGEAVGRDATGREARVGDAIEVRWKLERDADGRDVDKWVWWGARVGAGGRTVTYEGGNGFAAETRAVSFSPDRDGYLTDVREGGDALKWRKSTRGKKRREVAKVWRSNGAEVAALNEKEERALTTRRIDQFLASSRSVLGDGHQLTTKWCGSVLDGLMAALLVQNAMDVETVRVFTAIAAAFPATKEIYEEHARRQAIRKLMKNVMKRIVVCGDDESNSMEAAGSVSDVRSPKKAEREKARAQARAEAFALPEPITSGDELDLVNWYDVLAADESTLRDLLQRRGMQHILSSRMKTILTGILKERGTLRLEFLRDASREQIDAVLLSMDGVGEKTASLVKLLTLKRRAFPVDVHVAKILVRLGWIHLRNDVQIDAATVSAEQNISRFINPKLAHCDVERLFSLHVALIVLGKAFCHVRSPACFACPLNSQCQHYAEIGQTPIAAETPSMEDFIGPSTPTNQSDDDGDFGVGKILANFNRWNRRGRLMGAGLLEVLLLDPKADEADVNARFAMLSRRLHPDKNDGDDRKSAAFVAVKTARDAFKAFERSPSPFISTSADGLTNGLEVSNATKLAPSNVRRDLIAYVVNETTACFLPEELRRALGGKSRARGCLLVPLDADAQTLAQHTRLAICVPHRAAVRETFPIHASFFVTNEVFLDVASVNDPVVIRSVDLESFFHEVSRVFFAKSLHAACNGASKEELLSTFSGRSCCFHAWNRDTGTLTTLPDRFLPSAARPRTTNDALTSPAKRRRRDSPLAIESK